MTLSETYILMIIGLLQDKEDLFSKLSGNYSILSLKQA
jgi:hypothetical protein